MCHIYYIYLVRRVQNLGRVKKPINDKVLADWLDEEFKNKDTKVSYLSALRKFKEALVIDSLEEYLDCKPDVVSDLRKFALSLDGRPSNNCTIHT